MLYCDFTNLRVKARLTIQEHLNQMNTNNALSIQTVLSGFFLVRWPPSAATLSCDILAHKDLKRNVHSVFISSIIQLSQDEIPLP